MGSRLILSRSSGLRYAIGSLMYFAQGVPQGLLAIALPAWLASRGATASQIGSYLAVIVLPWAFKLLTGPIMDRFEFRPMGRRRPWILAAQLGLSLSLLALLLIEEPEQQLGLLMIIGVLINSFAATQDVAVDGLAIELTPVREHGRLNAFMSFGKTIGWASMAALSGVLLATWGLAAAAILGSLVTGLVFFIMVLVIEREGERRWPWSSGQSGSEGIRGRTFKQVFGGLNKVLWTRTSLLIIAIMFFDGLIHGYGHALMPIAAVQLFGMSSSEWSNLVAMMGLVGAVFALLIGPMIDRLGAKRMLVTVIALVGIHALILAQTQQLWQDTFYVRVMLSIWILMLPIVMVAILALAMAICSSGLSATQFAIYMSVANLGNAMGSKIYGMIGEQASWGQSYMLLATLIAVMIIILLFHREPSKSGDLSDRHAPSRHTIGIGLGEAGFFSSGTLPCPKCRSLMEEIDFKGVELDRCTACKGIWFDAGELESLRRPAAAKSIDSDRTSDHARMDAIRDIDCPRCGCRMDHVIDAGQQHVRYEHCRICEGAYLDAGEFQDLARSGLADWFRGLRASIREL